MASSVEAEYKESQGTEILTIENDHIRITAGLGHREFYTQQTAEDPFEAMKDLGTSHFAP